MKIFITVFLFIFAFQSLTNADDIKDFEIEEMSVGDSLLDYVSKDKIQSEKFFYDQAKSNKKFAHFEFLDVTNYDKVNVGFKDIDTRFIIKKISGFIWFENDIKNCLKKKDEIVESIQALFTNIKVENFDKYEHFADKNSYTYDSVFRFPGEYPQDNVRISCYDWSDSLPYNDHLNVSIVLSEYDSWLQELK